MKRVGTISSAIGFIFLGVWMMMENISPYIAKEMFNWWPTIFIILGLEILFYFGKRQEGQKIGFNFILILVLLIFFCINIYQSAVHRFDIWPKYFGNEGISIEDSMIFDDFSDGKYESSNFNKSFKTIDKKIILNVNNADLEIKKSKDDKVTIESNIYTENNYNNYDVDIDKGNINLKDDYIKGIKGIIYVPDGYIITMKADNLKLNCDDESFKNNFDIKSDNGMVNIKSDCEKVDIKLDDGKINVSNKLIKDMNIKMDRGSVKLDTKEKNLNANLNTDFGMCNFNGEKRLNAGIKKNTGTGSGILTVNLGHGTINVKNND